CLLSFSRTVFADGPQAVVALAAIRPVATVTSVTAVATITAIEATTAEAALAAAEATLALAAFTVAAARLQHGGRAFLQRLDPNRQVTQHVLVDAHVALHLDHRRRGGVDVEQDIVALAVLLDAEGEALQAPELLLGHVAALGGDDPGEVLGQAFDLRAGHVLARNKNVLVVRHPVRTPFGSSRSGAASPQWRSHRRIGLSRHLAALMRRFCGCGQEREPAGVHWA